MADLGLQTFDKLYPMLVKKYKNLSIDQNADIPDKINQIVNQLNALGKLSNDVVRDWNTVYNWAMNDGLTTDVNNKIEAMNASGELNSILTSLFNSEIGDLTTLQTVDKTNVVAAINDNVVSLAQKASQSDLQGRGINILYPPSGSGITAAKGDGITDDTQAFVTACNYLNSIGGGILIIPYANYLISPSQIVVYSNTTWVGIGKPKIFTKSASIYFDMVRTDPNKKVYNVGFYNIVFDQFSDTITVVPTAHYCLCFNDLDTVTVQNCSFNWVGTNAIHVTTTQRSGPYYLKDNQFTFQRPFDTWYDVSAYYGSSDYQEVTGNICKSIQKTGVTHNWKANGGLEIHSYTGYAAHNTIQDHYNGFNIASLSYNTTYDDTLKQMITVENNIFDRVNCGVTLYPNAASQNFTMKNITVKGNYCKVYLDGLGSTVSNQISGLLTFYANAGKDGNVQNLVIKDNYLTFVAAAGTTVSQISMDSFGGGISLQCCGQLTDCYIENNKIENYPQTVFNTRRRYDLVTGTPDIRHDSVHIKNNTIIDSAYNSAYTFTVGSCNNLEITDNRMIYRNSANRSVGVINSQYFLSNFTYLRNAKDSRISGFYPNHVSYVTNPTFVALTDENVLRQYCTFPQYGTPNIYYAYTNSLPKQTYYQNDIVYYAGSASAGYRGWVCTSTMHNAKTLGTINATRVAYKHFTLDSVTGLSVGDAISINGVNTLITAIDGNDIYTFLDTGSFTGSLPLTAYVGTMPTMTT